MTRLRVAVLEVLVQECGVELSDRTHPRKKDMVEALLSVLPVCAPMDVDIGENELDPCDQVFITDELIEEYASQVKLHTAELSRSAKVLADKEINNIQESMVLLATAIHWGTSHVTSPHHAQQYTTYMRAYLECTQEIFPRHSWRPNHHAALHIREFLLRYGPMHNWWMFLFERIIGALQKTNMNYKIDECMAIIQKEKNSINNITGELEKTMLETFCAAANVKAMMQNPTGPVILNEAAKNLGQCCDPFTGGEKTNIGILSTVGQDTNSHQDIHDLKTPVPDDLEKAWQIAETHLHQGRPYARCNHFTLYKQLNVLGVQYCGYAWSKEDSSVFFQWTPQEFVPGVIEYIFSTGEEDQQKYYFALRHNIPLAAEHQDPFQLYGDFGAQLWSSTHSQHLDIVPWGETNVVLKHLNRKEKQAQSFETYIVNEMNETAWEILCLLVASLAIPDIADAVTLSGY
ncbi:hypothetical protein DFJ58DRAFT_841643 [Suillus subalutaceus]|uniref:uncharacterized protein n=1 Tax=Suillus subalutaceus TaxID=48586 RepID=UPI001B87A3FE|nr:uncharacterized protein DFJ58DRAFT_841643 [Suillus subalutaceus]KAG1853463.1 hypothetical protein DFJ58DRAFT_841643 [Suillus subalutaceus]